MAEDLIANNWTSFCARRDILAKWHAHRCYDSSEANCQRPESVCVWGGVAQFSEISISPWNSLNNYSTL